jgi:hypothetical protein
VQDAALEAAGSLQRKIMKETNMRLGLSRLSSGLALLAVTLSTPAQSRIMRIEVAKVEPAFAGERFGAVGPFERVTGRAHGEVDPNSLENSIIQDIALAPRAVQRSQLTLHLNSSSSPARAAAYLSWLNVEF